MGIKYKELIEALSRVCRDKRISDSSSLVLENERLEKESNCKIGYILSPLEKEIYIDGNLYLELEKGKQVRLDDLTRALKPQSLFPNVATKRLVGWKSKEIYICRFGKSEEGMKKLLEVLPKETLAEVEFAAEYRYEDENEIPARRKVKFYNTYVLYRPLLEALKKVGYGIYEVKYRKEVDLQEILDGDIPIGFEEIKRVFPKS